ncbi:MAG: YhbY family RNA-binding protein [Oscillospiraceae bacterium]|nr:YhbY family RNA-binding protein [Oscillospiraceae bacterium]
MTSKERARLRGLANGIETVLQIGKDGIGENLIRQADITLEARELIKGRVLDGCAHSPREAAEALAQATNSEVIQVIGSKFVLYRKKKAVETEKKASKPRQREKPPLSLRDISPKGGDASGKAGKRFRALSGTETAQRGKKHFSAKIGQRDKNGFGAKAGQRDKISGAETGERSKKRSTAPMGRGTGGGVSRPNAFRKSDAAQRASRPGPRKPSQSGRPGPRKPFDAQRKPFSHPGKTDGGNRRK